MPRSTNSLVPGLIDFLMPGMIDRTYIQLSFTPLFDLKGVVVNPKLQDPAGSSQYMPGPVTPTLTVVAANASHPPNWQYGEDQSGKASAAPISDPLRAPAK